MPVFAQSRLILVIDFKKCKMFVIRICSLRAMGIVVLRGTLTNVYVGSDQLQTTKLSPLQLFYLVFLNYRSIRVCRSSSIIQG